MLGWRDGVCSAISSFKSYGVDLRPTRCEKRLWTGAAIAAAVRAQLAAKAT